MAKRGDNIRKRKDGRWEGRYKKGRAVDGCIIYGSVYGKTYKEVKEKMAAIISHPLQLATPKGQWKTFGEVLNLWMDNNRARLKGGTINKYQNLIDTHIMPELGQAKINELSATRINTFLNEKISRGRVDGSGGLSASYVRSIMLVINAAIKYAVSEQLCSPLKTPICKPSADKTELSILSAEEQKKLEASLLNNFDLTGAGIYISLHTGLRIGEVCSLAWNDIDMNKRVMLENHSSITAADVYSKLVSAGDNIYSEIKHVIRKELFSYLPPFKAALMSLGLSYSVFEKIILSAKKSGDYDFIMVDADVSFDEDKAALLNLADNVIVVVKQTLASVLATNILVSNINGANAEKYIYICNDFDKENDNALISPKVSLKFSTSDYIDHFVHYESMMPEDFSKENCMQKTAYLIL